MNCLRRTTLVATLIVSVTMTGCKSKQEAPGTKSAAPQQQAAPVKSISGKSAGGATVTAPKDRADAEAAAVRVLAEMESGDFQTIYREASPGFQNIGPEAGFVAKFQATRQKTGPFKGHQQSSIVTLPDQTHVLIYRAENDRFSTERRLSFARSKTGKMQLFGLNQHDEAKMRPAK